jgi:hypothetical protein
MFLLITGTVVTAQKLPAEYPDWIKKADALYKKGDYKSAGQAYSMAFKSFGWKGYAPDRYNAACSWALASVPDSAFSNLLRLATKANYADYDHLMRDPDLQSLRNDERWQLLASKVRENKEKLEINFDRKLIKVLDSLVTEDQKWRNYIVSFDNKQLGDDTTSRKTILYHLRATDSLNYFHLKNIFQRQGFPNYDLVGEKGSHNFWLLMQHQDLHPQFQEEVLERMKEEADKGKASMMNYAYLLDRVKVNTGQLQVYGTQMTLNSTSTSFEPKPVIEPEKLNERRKSVGLDAIESIFRSVKEVIANACLHSDDDSEEELISAFAFLRSVHYILSGCVSSATE